MVGGGASGPDLAQIGCIHEIGRQMCGTCKIPRPITDGGHFHRRIRAFAAAVAHVPKAQVVDKAAEDELGWIKLISSPISSDVHWVPGHRVVMQQPNQNRSRKAEERARRILPQPRIARGWISREARPFARFARSNAELDPALPEDCGLPRIFAHGRRF